MNMQPLFTLLVAVLYLSDEMQCSIDKFHCQDRGVCQCGTMCNIIDASKNDINGLIVAIQLLIHLVMIFFLLDGSDFEILFFLGGE